MTAIACLRILFNPGGESQPGEVPKSKAQAVADAFLKARWRAPRKCGAVAPLAFVLADNRVETFDPTEMQALAGELETVLFPGRQGGQVCLMTFEGDETAVLKFASLSQQDLAGLVAGKGYGGAAGRVHVITAEAVESVPSTRAEAKALAAEKAEAPPTEKSNKAAQSAPPVKAPPPPPQTGWWGVFDLSANAFAGSLIGMRADLVQPPPEDDDKLLKRDLICLTDAQAALKTATFGEIHVPFGFWNLTTPSAQESYKSRLSRYPLDQQPRLAATVYGTPREASLGMLQQIRAFLKGSFALLDLRVDDGTFPIHGLPPELIDSVTLLLTGETEFDRLSAIQKFAERKSLYEGKMVLQGVAGVGSRAELEACKAGGITRVQGRAITDLLDRPLAAAEGAPVVLG
ncbi:hypothetical protein [Caulobacter sp. BP25]|uniref:hypothetical protein n=1 Tax=Caulobacter sp. BP25 TaxID=2048900 RepID=UPI000C12BC4F|nr:hypothetical protein [Caulobacter sp. BP25]PHY17349.1 hypothetical protein CSW59_20250 [Caulobacter sp. BP25]